MITAFAGLIGVAFLLGVADAWEKSNGGRMFAFLIAGVVCLGVSIASIGSQPAHLTDECDGFSVFATSC